MAKQRVALTLESSLVHDVRALVGSRNLSSATERALTMFLERHRHLAAVDEWLDEMNLTHGPIPAETQEWADKLVAEWSREQARSRRVGNAAS